MEDIQDARCSLNLARSCKEFKNKDATPDKDLRSIPKQDVRRILKKIEALADNPRPSGSEKLGTQELYQVRQGSGQGEACGFSKRTGRCRPVRVLYEIQDAVLIIVVVRIGKRSDVYR